MRRQAAVTITRAFILGLLLAVVGTAASTRSSHAETIEIVGTVRDFQLSHPDFESYNGTERGIIATTLGEDDRPILVSDGSETITSQASFAQWYTDVEGVNLSTQYTITLENTAEAPTVYSVTHPDFFPIDDQLFGNEGLAHNYSFTFMFSTQFTYQGGETFEFTGDDDIWVFINRQLVVDLGGIHGPEYASADLDALAPTIGIEVGNSYSLHFFSAERRTTGSTFSMSGALFQTATQDCNSPGYDIDLDGDGWGQCSGDCCDDATTGCASDPSLVNPGAYDFLQNGIDDDCDGSIDNPPATTCSTANVLSDSADSSYASELVRAMDLCQFSTSDATNWGVIDASLLKADGSAASDANQVGVLTQLGGLIDPVENGTLAVLSSGRARGVDDPDWTRSTDYETGAAPVNVPSVYTDANGGTLTSAAGCPTGDPSVYDSVLLRLQVRTPTNARGFRYNFRFFSHEYPDGICSEYNDFFLALLTSSHADVPNDTNISFDESNNPVSVNNAFFTSCEPISCGADNTCPGVLTCNTASGECESSLGACPDGSDDLLAFVTNQSNAGATDWLATTSPITPGETITLDFHIWDTGDGSSDSLVLLDNFAWLSNATSVGTQIQDEGCGDGIIQPELNETCDSAGESATCDDDCTAVVCGDGNHNATAGEACDDGNGSNSDSCLDAAGSSCVIAFCGDGYVHAGVETCDDTNTVSGDGCSDTCETQAGYTCTGTPSACIETPTCGDGVIAGDEVCDDAGDSLTCDNDCTPAVCGDGYRNPILGELCDDGNNTVNDACPDGTEGTCQSAACGDGYLYVGQETCEDLNNIAGDGCSSLCVVEAGYTCVGLPSVCSTTCGDGIAAGTEACDEGGDGATCDADCTESLCGDGYLNTAAGETCDDGNQTLTDSCPDGVTMGCRIAVCGDGFLLDNTEACDDGNSLNADGCSTGCAVESGFTCSGAPSTCTTTCGDGIAAGYEPCDDAGDSATCNSDCTLATCGDGYVNAAAGEVCDDGNDEINDGCPDGADGTCQLATCGDGLIFFGPEVCDDGNTANYDGCTSACAPEAGYTCTDQPSICSATCGDGVVAADEDCDDAIETIECDTDCTPAECGDGNVNITAGETCDDGNGELHDACPDGPDAPCVSAFCGDGIIWSGQESCDDGNGFSLDGCSNVCGVEAGFVCTGEPTTCWTICGDGIIAGNETCDDANTTSGDGCSDTCLVETGYACTNEPSTCATVCGDAITIAPEECDDGEQSDTCDVDCTFAVCGDGYRNTQAGELCDDGNAILNDACPDGPEGDCISAACGDGIIRDATEACDDGGTASGDGCTAMCVIENGWECGGEPSQCWTVCGDGIRAGDELCDDGNQDDGDSCLSNCGVPFCGDGHVMEFMETCDDGNEDLQDACPDGPMGPCSPAVCGDGFVWADQESCDDKNTTPGDGCSATCGVEPGYTCNGQPSTCTTLCGDGISAGNEACDDAGESPTCNGDCSLHACGDGYINTLAGETCDDGDHMLNDGCPDGPGGSCQSARCGDGYRSPGSEGCDDGNTVPGDGCSESCTIDLGYVCYGQPSECITICGDGIPAGEEQCDDLGSSDTCNGDCTLSACGDGYRNAGAGESCDDGNADITDSCPDGEFGNCQPASCGDGFIFAALELCDDGNTIDGDGCSSSCLPEFGYICAGRPSQCETICGDGIQAGLEECDDSGESLACDGDCTAIVCGDGYVNLTANETCDDGNQVLSDPCPDGPMGTCQSSFCGDGYLWLGEELCEDANTDAGDGCSALCQVEDGWVCSEDIPCTGLCGDGLIRSEETCDDANLDDGDGCSSTCAIEPGWACTLEPSSCVEDNQAGGTADQAGDSEAGQPSETIASGTIMDPSDVADVDGTAPAEQQARGVGIVSELPDPAAWGQIGTEDLPIAPPEAMTEAGLELRGSGTDCSQGQPSSMLWLFIAWCWRTRMRRLAAR